MACHRASSSDSGEAGDNHIPRISSSLEGGRPGSPGLSRVLSGLPGWLTRGQSWEVVLAVRQPLWSCWRSWSLRHRSSPTPGWLAPEKVPCYLTTAGTPGLCFSGVHSNLWLQWTWQEESCEKSVLADRSPQLLTLVNLLAKPEFLSGSDGQVSLQQKRRHVLARWSV